MVPQFVSQPSTSIVRTARAVAARKASNQLPGERAWAKAGCNFAPSTRARPGSGKRSVSGYRRLVTQQRRPPLRKSADRGREGGKNLRAFFAHPRPAKIVAENGGECAASSTTTAAHRPSRGKADNAAISHARQSFRQLGRLRYETNAARRRVNGAGMAMGLPSLTPSRAGHRQGQFFIATSVPFASSGR